MASHVEHKINEQQKMGPTILENTTQKHLQSTPLIRTLAGRQSSSSLPRISGKRLLILAQRSASQVATICMPHKAIPNNFVFCKAQSNIYDPLTNYLTDVGTFSKSKSSYKVYDLSGLVYEWNDLNGSLSPERGLRGGYWFSAGQSTISTTFSTSTIDRESSDAGFRIAALSDSSLLIETQVARGFC